MNSRGKTIENHTLYQSTFQMKQSVTQSFANHSIPECNIRKHVLFTFIYTIMHSDSHKLCETEPIFTFQTFG